MIYDAVSCPKKYIQFTEKVNITVTVKFRLKCLDCTSQEISPTLSDELKMFLEWLIAMGLCYFLYITVWQAISSHSKGHTGHTR